MPSKQQLLDLALKQPDSLDNLSNLQHSPGYHLILLLCSAKLEAAQARLQTCSDMQDIFRAQGAVLAYQEMLNAYSTLEQQIEQENDNGRR